MEIEIDQVQLRDVQSALTGIKNGYPKVLTRAINKSMTGIRTDATAEIYKELNLTKKRIRKDFKIRKMTWTKLEAWINSKGKPVGLASFTGTWQTKKGVSAKVKRATRKKVIRHAFTNPVGGIKHAFLRKKVGGVRVGRYPIERLTGPRIQDIYANKQVMARVLKKADARMSKNLNRELNYELSKL